MGIAISKNTEKMKILVAVKRVLDSNVAVRLKSDGTGVDLTGQKMSVNPFDEIAVEEAVRLKELKIVNEVVVVTCGPQQSKEALITSLAMGADRAIHVLTSVEIEPLNVAKIIRLIADKEKPGLILLGKQAIDDDCNQTGQMLAQMMNMPQATNASKIEIEGEYARVTKEIDGGQEKIKIKMPALITADLRLNEPRYVTLPNIMKAKKKIIEETKIEEFGIDLAQRITNINIKAPEKRKQGIILKNTQELIDKLKTEARVI